MSLTLLLIIVTAAVSITALNQPQLFSRLKFNAYDAGHTRHWYRFITYGFVHADYLHLAVNMLVLYSFGNVTEKFFGLLFPEKAGLYFLLLYIGGIMLSIIPAFSKHRNDVFYNAVGASGAVSAVLFASILLYPSGKIMLLLIPIPLPAPVFGLLYLGYEYYMSRRANDNIGHDAHFWGAVFGVLFVIILKPGILRSFITQIFS